MKRRSRLSLIPSGFRKQLVLTFTIGIACLALVSSIAISSLSSQTVRAKLVEQGRQVAETFAAQSTLALLYQSPDNARNAAQTTLAFPDIQGIAIYDPEHRVLLSEGDVAVPPDGSGRAWPREVQLEQETRHAWYFVAPVYVGQDDTDQDESPFVTQAPVPELVGFVRVVMGKDTLKTMASDILRGNLVISVVLAAVLLLLLLGITTRMTRPLKALAESMHRAELGEKHVRAEMGGPQDIVNMETAFNTMMAVLEAREQELERTRDAALESARIKAEFAANVSHELRTPLNGVLGMLELLQDMGLTPQQREYAEVARSSGESLLALINNILDFSRIDSGKLRLNRVDYSLRGILDNVVELLARQAQRKELDLGYIIAPDVPAILRGDPDRIRQLLFNLVGNAVKFTEQGQVAIEVHALEPDSVLLRFEVKDTGIGIPRDAQERIFEAFAQADGSMTRRYGGTGLGLAICRQLVDLMGGEIGVDSEPGTGSTFWFVLRMEQSSRASEAPGIEGTALAGLRVLIADDSAVNCSFLAHAFSAWGTYHDSAANGLEALKKLRLAAEQGRPYDIAIVDQSLSGIKGTDLARQIAEDPTGSQVRVVLMSNQQLDREEPFPVGVADRIEKPLGESSIYECLATVMKQPAEGVPKPRPATTDEAAVHLGSRILIVEDNRANQQVAVGMLERLGCTVDTVANGSEGLDAVARRPYGLVLMDCQMPQMDGYEATRRIRALETGIPRLPIVAMTAHVRRDDGDRCLAAGMDDYLVKPLKLDTLREKLQRWLPAQRAESIHAKSGGRVGLASAQRGTADPLDRKVLGELHGGVGGAFATIIEVFLEDTPTYLGSLEDAVATGDAQALADGAHKIKGSARNLGANRLAAACSQLEEMTRSGSTDGATELLSSLVTEYELVKAALQHEVRPEAGGIDSADIEPPRILIVDDERGMRLALRNVLEEDGYRIEEAEHGAQALAICERLIPDLVLMDAMMPVLDGFAACAQMRELPGGGNTPVLIITALDDEQSIERAFAAGATDFIPKPVHFGVLRKRAARLLDASRAEMHVRRLAYRDALTGLPNRTLFQERLGELLAQAHPKKQRLAILLLDLDRFQLVNDTLGHDTGDLLLKAVGGRIGGCVRAADLVARFGGDEFTVILDGIKSPQVVAGVVEKIRRALSAPFVFMEREIFVTASIGISMYPADGKDIGTLIKHADTAMYGAKEHGDRHQFYEAAMEAVVTQRVELESDLRRALERNELVLHYQPLADLSIGKIVSLEALVRWAHPKRGLIPPSDFIPLAEETGLIIALGEWTLREASAQMQSWLARGWSNLRIAVNLSGRQLEREDLPQRVATVLKETGLPPALLELEITESTIMKRPEHVISTLHKLKEMGITLAVDDFGTGYSSLSYLKRFPIDKLKIDRSFVRDITTDPDDAALTSGIIALAQSLRLKVVAEGVETKEQKVFLKQRKCDLIQGYHLSKPLPAPELEQWLLREGQAEE